MLVNEHDLLFWSPKTYAKAKPNPISLSNIFRYTDDNNENNDDDRQTDTSVKPVFFSNSRDLESGSVSEFQK